MEVEASGSEATAWTFLFTELPANFGFLAVVWLVPFWYVLESKWFFWVELFEDAIFVFQVVTFFFFGVVVAIVWFSIFETVVAIAMVDVVVSVVCWMFVDTLLNCLFESRRL
jgi:hypothetical protein